MDPLNLQTQIRHNSEDLVNFCSELKQWGEEMKNKDAALKAGYDLDNAPKKRNEAKSIAKPKAKAKKSVKPLDYAVWDKYDADAECAKLDEENDIDSGDLTDEVDEDAHDAAIYEKEKGNNLVKNQKWEQAIACYTKAIEHYAYDPIFYANRALCYLKTEKYKEAESDCTSALQLDKTYVKAYQRRAAAREAINQLTEAHCDLLKVFDYEPNNKESKNALSKLEKKLVAINCKPKVESSSQRPKSKFTLSQQRKNVSVKQTPKAQSEEINLNQSVKASTYWASGNEIELVKPINKLPHLRSKKPLRRIPIQTIDGETITQTEETVQPWPRPGYDNKLINCDSLKIVERKNEKQTATAPTKKSLKIHSITDYKMSAPTTSIQFASDWRLLGDELRYKYLKQVDPNKIPTLFKESLDCDVFSGLLHTLAVSFIQNNDSVYEYLLKLSEVKRFSMLIMFMADSDKEDISKLFSYMRSRNELTKDKVDELWSKYES